MAQAYEVFDDAAQTGAKVADAVSKKLDKLIPGLSAASVGANAAEGDVEGTLNAVNDIVLDIPYAESSIDMLDRAYSMS